MGDLPDSDPLAPYRTAVARACKAGDTEQIAAARRALREAKLREHIKRVVDEAPPFTPEQRARLAALLTGAAA